MPVTTDWAFRIKVETEALTSLQKTVSALRESAKGIGALHTNIKRVVDTISMLGATGPGGVGSLTSVLEARIKGIEKRLAEVGGDVAARTGTRAGGRTPPAGTWAGDAPALAVRRGNPSTIEAITGARTYTKPNRDDVHNTAAAYFDVPLTTAQSALAGKGPVTGMVKGPDNIYRLDLPQLLRQAMSIANERIVAKLDQLIGVVGSGGMGRMGTGAVHGRGDHTPDIPDTGDVDFFKDVAKPFGRGHNKTSAASSQAAMETGKPVVATIKTIPLNETIKAGANKIIVDELQERIRQGKVDLSIPPARSMTLSKFREKNPQDAPVKDGAGIKEHFFDIIFRAKKEQLKGLYHEDDRGFGYDDLTTHLLRGVKGDLKGTDERELNTMLQRFVGAQDKTVLQSILNRVIGIDNKMAAALRLGSKRGKDLAGDAVDPLVVGTGDDTVQHHDRVPMVREARPAEPPATDTQRLQRLQADLKKEQSLHGQAVQFAALARTLSPADVARLSRSDRDKIESAPAALAGHDAKIKEMEGEIAQLRSKSGQKFSGRVSSHLSRMRGALSEQATDLSVMETSRAMYGHGQATLGDQFADATRRAALYGTAATALYGGYQTIRGGVRTMADNDQNLTNIRRVLNPIGADMPKISSESRTMAVEYGAAITDVTAAMETFAQQGMATNRIIDSTRTALLAQNVTNLNVNQSVEALTATQRQFKMSMHDNMRILDAWNEVENTTSVQTNILTQAILKAGTAANVAGFSLDQYLGVVASMGEATRKGGDSLGTSMQFILSRLKTPDVVGSMEEVGVQSRSADGATRSGFDVLDELAGKWKKLSQAQRDHTALQIAGTRHANDFLVMMDGWDRAMDITVTSLLSAGSATRENDIAMTSLNKKVAQLSASWQVLWTSLGESGAVDALKNLVDGLGKVLQLVGSIGGLMPKGTGGLMGVLGLAGTAGLTTAAMHGGGIMLPAIWTSVETRMKAAKAATIHQANASARADATAMNGAVGRNSSMMGSIGAAMPSTIVSMDARSSGGKIKPKSTGMAHVPISRMPAMMGATIAASEMGRGIYFANRDPEEKPSATSAAVNVGADLATSAATARMLGGMGGFSGRILSLTAATAGLLTAFTHAKEYFDTLRTSKGIEGNVTHLNAMQSRFADVLSGVREARGAFQSEGGGLAGRELMDSIEAVVPGVMRPDAKMADNLEAAEKALRELIAQLRKQQGDQVGQLVSERFSSVEAGNLIRKMENLERRITGTKDVGERLNLTSQLGEARTSLYDMTFRPLLAQAQLSGSANSGLGAVLDNPQLQEILRRTGISEDDAGRQYLAAHVKGRGLGDITPKTKDATAGQIRAGHIQYEEQGPIFRIADGSEVEMVGRNVEQWSRSIRDSGGFLLEAYNRFEGRSLVSAESFKRLIDDYAGAVVALQRKNSELVRSIADVNESMMGPFGAGAGDLLRAAQRMGEGLGRIRETGVSSTDIGDIGGNRVSSYRRMVERLGSAQDSGIGVSMQGLLAAQDRFVGNTTKISDDFKNIARGLIEAVRRGDEPEAAAATGLLSTAFDPKRWSQVESLIVDLRSMKDTAGAPFQEQGGAIMDSVGAEFSKQQNEVMRALSQTFRDEIGTARAFIQQSLQALAVNAGSAMAAGRVRSPEEYLATPEASDLIAQMKAVASDLATASDRSRDMVSVAIQSRRAGIGTDGSVEVMRQRSAELVAGADGVSRTMDALNRSFGKMVEGVESVVSMLEQSADNQAATMGMTGGAARGERVSALLSGLSGMSASDPRRESVGLQLQRAIDNSKVAKSVEEDLRRRALANLPAAAMIGQVMGGIGMGSGNRTDASAEALSEGFTDAVQVFVRDNADAIAKLGSDDRSAFLRTMVQQLSPLAKPFRDLQDPGNRFDYMMSTDSQKTLYDDVRGRLDSGEDAASILSDPAMRYVVQDNAAVRDLLKESLASSTAEEALRYQKDIAANTLNMVGVLANLAGVLSKMSGGGGESHMQGTLGSGSPAVSNGRIRGTRVVMAHDGEVILNRKQADAMGSAFKLPGFQGGTLNQGQDPAWRDTIKLFNDTIPATRDTTGHMRFGYREVSKPFQREMVDAIEGLPHGVRRMLSDASIVGASPWLGSHGGSVGDKTYGSHFFGRDITDVYESPDPRRPSMGSVLSHEVLGHQFDNYGMHRDTNLPISRMDPLFDEMAILLDDEAVLGIGDPRSHYTQTRSTHAELFADAAMVRHGHRPGYWHGLKGHYMQQFGHLVERYDDIYRLAQRDGIDRARQTVMADARREGLDKLWGSPIMTSAMPGSGVDPVGMAVGDSVWDYTSKGVRPLDLSAKRSHAYRLNILDRKPLVPQPATMEGRVGSSFSVSRHPSRPSSMAHHRLVQGAVQELPSKVRDYLGRLGVDATTQHVGGFDQEAFGVYYPADKRIEVNEFARIGRDLYGLNPRDVVGVVKHEAGHGIDYGPYDDNSFGQISSFDPVFAKTYDLAMRDPSMRRHMRRYSSLASPMGADHLAEMFADAGMVARGHDPIYFADPDLYRQEFPHLPKRYLQIEQSVVTHGHQATADQLIHGQRLPNASTVMSGLLTASSTSSMDPPFGYVVGDKLFRKHARTQRVLPYDNGRPVNVGGSIWFADPESLPSSLDASRVTNGNLMKRGADKRWENVLALGTDPVPGWAALHYDGGTLVNIGRVTETMATPEEFTQRLALSSLSQVDRQAVEQVMANTDHHHDPGERRRAEQEQEFNRHIGLVDRLKDFLGPGKEGIHRFAQIGVEVGASRMGFGNIPTMLRDRMRMSGRPADDGIDAIIDAAISGGVDDSPQSREDIRKALLKTRKLGINTMADTTFNGEQLADGRKRLAVDITSFATSGRTSLGQGRMVQQYLAHELTHAATAAINPIAYGELGTAPDPLKHRTLNAQLIEMLAAAQGPMTQSTVGAVVKNYGFDPRQMSHPGFLASTDGDRFVNELMAHLGPQASAGGMPMDRRLRAVLETSSGFSERLMRPQDQGGVDRTVTEAREAVSRKLAEMGFTGNTGIAVLDRYAEIGHFGTPSEAYAARSAWLHRRAGGMEAVADTPGPSHPGGASMEGRIRQPKGANDPRFMEFEKWFAANPKATIAQARANMAGLSEARAADMLRAAKLRAGMPVRARKPVTVTGPVPSAPAPVPPPITEIAQPAIPVRPARSLDSHTWLVPPARPDRRPVVPPDTLPVPSHDVSARRLDRVEPRRLVEGHARRFRKPPTPPWWVAIPGSQSRQPTATERDMIERGRPFTGFEPPEYMSPASRPVPRTPTPLRTPGPIPERSWVDHLTPEGRKLRERFLEHRRQAAREDSHYLLASLEEQQAERRRSRPAQEELRTNFDADNLHDETMRHIRDQARKLGIDPSKYTDKQLRQFVYEQAVNTEKLKAMGRAETDPSSDPAARRARRAQMTYAEELAEARGMDPTASNWDPRLDGSQIDAFLKQHPSFHSLAMEGHKSVDSGVLKDHRYRTTPATVAESLTDAYKPVMPLSERMTQMAMRIKESRLGKVAGRLSGYSQTGVGLAMLADPIIRNRLGYDVVGEHFGAKGRAFHDEALMPMLGQIFHSQGMAGMAAGQGFFGVTPVASAMEFLGGQMKMRGASGAAAARAIQFGTQASRLAQANLARSLPVKGATGAALGLQAISFGADLARSMGAGGAITRAKIGWDDAANNRASAGYVDMLDLRRGDEALRTLSDAGSAGASMLMRPIDLTLHHLGVNDLMGALVGVDEMPDPYQVAGENAIRTAEMFKYGDGAKKSAAILQVASLLGAREFDAVSQFHRHADTSSLFGHVKSIDEALDTPILAHAYRGMAPNRLVDDVFPNFGMEPDPAERRINERLRRSREQPTPMDDHKVGDLLDSRIVDIQRSIKKKEQMIARYAGRIEPDTDRRNTDELRRMIAQDNHRIEQLRHVQARMDDMLAQDSKVRETWRNDPSQWYMLGSRLNETDPYGYARLMGMSADIGMIDILAKTGDASVAKSFYSGDKRDNFNALAGKMPPGATFRDLIANAKSIGEGVPLAKASQEVERARVLAKRAKSPSPYMLDRHGEVGGLELDPGKTIEIYRTMVTNAVKGVKGKKDVIDDLYKDDHVGDLMERMGLDLSAKERFQESLHYLTSPQSLDRMPGAGHFVPIRSGTKLDAYDEQMTELMDRLKSMAERVSASDGAMLARNTSIDGDLAAASKQVAGLDAMRSSIASRGKDLETSFRELPPRLQIAHLQLAKSGAEPERATWMDLIGRRKPMAATSGEAAFLIASVQGMVTTARKQLPFYDRHDAAVAHGVTLDREFRKRFEAPETDIEDGLLLVPGTNSRIKAKSALGTQVANRIKNLQARTRLATERGMPVAKNISALNSRIISGENRFWDMVGRSSADLRESAQAWSILEDARRSLASVGQLDPENTARWAEIANQQKEIVLRGQWGPQVYEALYAQRERSKAAEAMAASEAALQRSRDAKAFEGRDDAMKFVEGSFASGSMAQKNTQLVNALGLFKKPSVIRVHEGERVLSKSEAADFQQSQHESEDESAFFQKPRDETAFFQKPKSPSEARMEEAVAIQESRRTGLRQTMEDANQEAAWALFGSGKGSERKAVRSPAVTRSTTSTSTPPMAGGSMPPSLPFSGDGYNGSASMFDTQAKAFVEQTGKEFNGKVEHTGTVTLSADDTVRNLMTQMIALMQSNLKDKPNLKPGDLVVAPTR